MSAPALLPTNPRPPEAAASSGSEFLRRRGVVVRHRRRRWLLWCLGLGGRLTLTLGVPVFSMLWLLTSPRFALAKVAAIGTPRVPAAWVEAELLTLEGENLLRLPLGLARAKVSRHPWVASVALRKRLPDRLEVEIVERHPEAVVSQAGTWSFADGAGNLIAPLGTEAAGDELVQVIGVRRVPADVANALAVARELRASPGTWAAGRRLKSVEVLGDDDFRLLVDGVDVPVVVAAGSLMEKSQLLDSLLPEIPERFPTASELDLRFAKKIVVESRAGEGAAHDEETEVGSAVREGADLTSRRG